jgi:hypothetical protein
MLVVIILAAMLSSSGVLEYGFLGVVAGVIVNGGIAVSYIVVRGR